MDLLNTFWKEAERVKHLAAYRGAIRRARPYRLDREATELVTELSSGDTIAEKLPIYRKLARLPFDTVWIEMSYKDRFDTRQRLGTTSFAEYSSELPEHLGFLLERVTDTQWKCLTVVSYQDGSATQSGRICDTFGAILHVSTDGPVVVQSEAKDSIIRNVVDGLNAKNIGLGGWGFGTSIDGVDHYSFPEELKDSAAIDIAPSVEQIISTHFATDKRKVAEEQLIRALSEIKGDIRFVVAALATINECPITTADFRPDGKTLVGGRIRPFLINRTVSINIPKRRRVNKALAMIRLAERAMRRHEVSGHWRTITLKDGTKQRKWVESYARGDASLGYVRQVREVTRA